MSRFEIAINKPPPKEKKNHFKNFFKGPRRDKPLTIRSA